MGRTARSAGSCSALAPLGEVVALGRAEADLARPDTLAGIVADHRPDVIVNAAAYTAVDRAEEEPEVAQRINAESVGILAQQAAGREAILLHYSTDYVFDGEARTPYAEDAPTRPRSVYGLSKRGGEEAIVRSGCRHLLFRTSWVYSARGRNFLTRILELAGERDSLRIVADQRGAPTGAELIADVTALALRQFARGGESGFYHLTATGETTWFDYATHIVRRARSWALPSNAAPRRSSPPRPRHSARGLAASLFRTRHAAAHGAVRTRVAGLAHGR